MPSTWISYTTAIRLLFVYIVDADSGYLFENWMEVNFNALNCQIFLLVVVTVTEFVLSHMQF